VTGSALVSSRRGAAMAAGGTLALAAAVGTVMGARFGLYAIAAAVGVVLLLNFELSILLLTASGFFGTAAANSGGPLGVVKLLGGLALGAWLIDWAVRRRRVVVLPDYLILGLLLLWMVPTSLLAQNRSDAIHTTARYAMFAGLFFLVVQYAHEERSMRRFVDTSIAAATIASAVGLGIFISGRAGQASGPLAHNDFAFVLTSALPMAVWRARRTTARWQAMIAGLGGLLIGLAILGTLSRGALVGLGFGVLWAVSSRRTRLFKRTAGTRPNLLNAARRRTVVNAAAVVALVLAVVLGAAVKTGALDRAFSQKSAISAQNIDSRLYYWDIALRELRAYPLTGVGPGNYTDQFTQYGPVYDWTKGVQTTHNTYLNVLAEDGPVGFAFFAVFLYCAWRRMRIRGTPGTASDELQTALAFAFLATLVAASFLTEQYQPPLWTLPALAAVAPVTRLRLTRGTAQASDFERH
jgi:putative inorganic carbon (hco3(-)) transporter